MASAAKEVVVLAKEHRLETLACWAAECGLARPAAAVAAPATSPCSDAETCGTESGRERPAAASAALATSLCGGAETCGNYSSPEGASSLGQCS